MTRTASQVAEQVSFETFINCYLRELGTGVWHTAHQWATRVDRSWPRRGALVLELALPEQATGLALDVTYRSTAGRHRLGAVRVRRESGWRDIEPFAVLMLLVRELSLARRDAATDVARTESVELVSRLAQSQQLIARYVDARRDDLRLNGDRFIESEQSLLYGHWSHPTPKSRQGMADWHHSSYAPELRGEFKLCYFAAHRSLVRQQSALSATAEELILTSLLTGSGSEDEVRRARAAGEVLIPVHPLQLDWLLHHEPAREWLRAGVLRQVGPLGLPFTATSSVRTVYSPSSDWMLKFSIPVKITNSLRQNQRHELCAGVVMASLLERLGVELRYPGFSVIPDPAYITLDAPGQRESGFEVILRANPFKLGSDSGVCSVAAVAQDPLPHRPSRLSALVEGLALTEGRSVEVVCLEWFGRYWDCAIEPLVRLYDEHGVALEAHQQNSLLDLSAGYPRRYYYRDNQGFYLSASHQRELTRLAPELRQTPELFYADDLICERLSYYLIANQLFSLIHRFGSDGLLDEERLLALCRQRLSALKPRLRGPGQELVRRLLEEPRLPYKANLLTRLHDVDELTAELERAIYTTIDNPLCHARALADKADREVA